MSKQIVEGTIDKVFVKKLPQVDDNGNEYTVAIAMDGQWYGLGRKRKDKVNIKVGDNWHRLSDGDTIQAVCDVVERGDKVYRNIRTTDIELKKAGTYSNKNSEGKSGTTSNASKNTGGGFKANNDDRQDAIMRQSAMGYAAQIVAGTLTAKSDLDKAAAEVVRLANDYLVPYAKHGITETQKKEEELSNQNQAAQASSEEDFNDDIPF